MTSNSSKPKVTSKEYIFELAAYLVTCAEMSLSPRGSRRYSAMHFTRVLRKIIDLPEYVKDLEKDPFLLKIKDELDQLKTGIEYQEEFQHQLQKILIEFAEEAERRLK
jgi:hypothetical protein